MENKSYYDTIDKSDWPDGPWMKEFDKSQFVDEATGLPCLIVRNNLGNLCGYVGVKRGHPAYKKDYDDVDVSVHGGLTYADFCQEHSEESKGICHLPGKREPKRIYWLGFDCAHCYDLVPGMLKFHNEFRSQYPAEFSDVPDRDVYRDVEYVRNECRSLAKQLAEMK